LHSDQNKIIMKYIVTTVRILLGLLFLVSFIGFFFKLMPQPVLNDSAKLFVTGLMASAYLMPFIKIVELLCAIAFLSGRFVSLATVMIFPITINILLFHFFLAPDGIIVSLILFLGNLFLAYSYRDNYRTLMLAK
jgi:putative oxidoreductase